MLSTVVMLSVFIVVGLIAQYRDLVADREHRAVRKTLADMLNARNARIAELEKETASRGEEIFRLKEDAEFQQIRASKDVADRDARIKRQEAAIDGFRGHLDRVAKLAASYLQ